jgi:capsular exopolysaccharide synthesis family protein
MVTEAPTRDPIRSPQTLAALGVLRRRWFTLLATLVVTVGVSFAIDVAEHAAYKAESLVYLNPDSLVNQVSGGEMPATDSLSLARKAQTQATIAHSPEVAALALRLGRIRGLTVNEVLGETTVSPASNADLLDIAVVDPSPRRAMRLANAYADAYTSYALSLATTPLKAAIANLRRSISALGKNGSRNRSLYANLAAKQEQLESISALEASGTAVVERPIKSVKVRPRRTLNGLLAILVGLVLGSLFMWLHETLDTRLRTEAEIDDALGLPLLGRLSRPRETKATGPGSLVTIAEPYGLGAEEFRLLRTSIDFASIGKPGATMLMFSSAQPAEGKSTTVANFAVTLARLGKRTLIVDLDLRNPRQGFLFNARTGLGLTDVVRGNATVDEVLIRLEPSVLFGSGSGSGAEVIHLLDTGTLPPNVGDFLVLPQVRELLQSLADSGDFDVLLVDTPPMLSFADARTLSDLVDALVVIARLGVLERPAAAELRRAVEVSPVTCYGYVLTDAANGASAYSYGPGYAYGSRGKASATEDVALNSPSDAKST